MKQVNRPGPTFNSQSLESKGSGSVGPHRSEPSQVFGRSTGKRTYGQSFLGNTRSSNDRDMPAQTFKPDQDTFNFFRGKWGSEQISDLEIALALEFGILSMNSFLHYETAITDISKALPGTTVDIVSQTKRQLHYQMFNQKDCRLSKDQHKDFQKDFQYVRRCCEENEISDACLFVHLKNKLIDLRSELGKAPKEKGPPRKNFFDGIQRMATNHVRGLRRDVKRKRESGQVSLAAASVSSVSPPSGRIETLPPSSGSPAMDRTPSPYSTARPFSEVQCQHDQKRPTDTDIRRVLTESYLPKLESKLKLKRHSVITDGNCFYSAAAYQANMTAKKLREDMEEEIKALLKDNARNTDGFFGGGGYTKEHYKTQLNGGYILKQIPPISERKEGERYGDRWGTTDHLPLLARTLKRPVVLFAMLPENLGADPKAFVCYDKKGKSCDFADISKDESPIHMLFDGIDHFDALVPAVQQKEE